MIKTRRFYTLLLWVLLPSVFWHLFKRSRHQPAYLEHVAERFGNYAVRPQTPAQKPLIWLHAVSVGETRAAAPLLKRLLETYPQHQILLTHMTPTGREAGRELYGDTVLQCYLPYDFPFAVERFLHHFKPTIGMLMETEIWFNLIGACKQKNIPLLLVNARMSEKSAAKYARFSALTHASLRALRGIAAQTQADADRLSALGAPAVQIMGNLKFDISPPPASLALGVKLRQCFGESRPVLLAASTREAGDESEEALLLDVLEKFSVPGLLLLIVPRHPQRFDNVAALLQSRGIRFQRRSQLPTGGTMATDIQVVLGDSMGEMFAYYAACDLAFIGGSLLPLGGQNLIEACAAGKPVLVGTHTFNFNEATQLAIVAGAASRVQNAEELAREVSALLGDPARLAVMSQAAFSFAVRHRGATERIMQMVTKFV